MENVIKKLFLLVLAVIVVIFVIILIWGDEEKGTHGFRDLGVVADASTEVEMTADGLEYLYGEEKVVPTLRYIGGVKKVGDSIDFRELFEIQLKDGTTLSGTQEGDFYLYLEDITDEKGDRKFITLYAEENAAVEEISSPIVYEKDTRKLCFNESGTYHVFVRIYGKSGRMETYEFKLPVEID